MGEISDDGNLHIIPDDDLWDHVEKESCQCNPEWEKVNKKKYLRHQEEYKIFIHNRLIDNPQ